MTTFIAIVLGALLAREFYLTHKRDWSLGLAHMPRDVDAAIVSILAVAFITAGLAIVYVVCNLILEAVL